MNDRNIAFVIMQIGNSELDKIYSDIYIPAIKEANLIPKRIDQDNSGKLLKSEIVEFIEDAEIIIADLTNERPNCYLEVGYAMGLDKFKNLIFTVREDHFPESVNFVKGGPKIHFDVSGYDILFWDKNGLADFKTKLTNKIKTRLTTITPNIKVEVKKNWNEDWLQEKREYVNRKLEVLEINRQMEILISPVNKHISLSQNKLQEIANESQIDTLGWPIAPIIPHVPEFGPKPKVDGVVSEIFRKQGELSFDFSYFLKDGKIFLSKSLFEEHHFKSSIIVPIRVKRTTEILIYTLRYFYKCGLQPDDLIEIEIKYNGIKNNNISFGSEGVAMRNYICSENESYSSIKETLGNIESNVIELVYELTNQLFVLFDFFNYSKERIESISSTYITEINARR